MGYVRSSHESRNIPSEICNHEGRLHLSKIAILPSKGIRIIPPVEEEVTFFSFLSFLCCNGLSHQGSIGHFLGGLSSTSHRRYVTVTSGNALAATADEAADVHVELFKLPSDQCPRQPTEPNESPCCMFVVQGFWIDVHFYKKNQTTTHWSNKIGIIMFNVDCWPLFSYLFIPFNQTGSSSIVVSHDLHCWGFLVKLWWVQMVCGLIKLLICMFDIHPPGEWWLITLFIRP